MVPPGTKMAVLSGNPAGDSLYTVRVKMPANYRIPAHSHPKDEHVMVLSGSLSMGMGDKLDLKGGKALGVGGFAMAAAPAIVQFVGGSPQDALDITRRMYEITVTENDVYRIPILDFRGTPTAIDLRKVVETGILPAINTGIAHKEPGVGMVGAGLVKPPESCFKDALAAFGQAYAP